MPSLPSSVLVAHFITNKMDARGHEWKTVHLKELKLQAKNKSQMKKLIHISLAFDSNTIKYR